MRKRFNALVGLTAVVAVVAAVSVSSASANGCTPGFWKNKGVSLYNENASVSTVFVTSDFGSWTLLSALQGGGGNTLVQKKQILLRAAVAAYLNYTVQPSHTFYTQFSGAFDADGVQYETAEFVALVNTALASTDATAILALATHIDIKNNEHAAGSICT